jgi:hypothetical protein
MILERALGGNYEHASVMNGFNHLMKGFPESSLLFYHLQTLPKDNHQEMRKPPLTRTRIYKVTEFAYTWNFPVCRAVRNKDWLFVDHLFCGILVIAVWKIIS